MIVQHMVKAVEISATLLRMSGEEEDIFNESGKFNTHTKH